MSYGIKVLNDAQYVVTRDGEPVTEPGPWYATMEKYRELEDAEA